MCCGALSCAGPRRATLQYATVAWDALRCDRLRRGVLLCAVVRPGARLTTPALRHSLYFAMRARFVTTAALCVTLLAAAGCRPRSSADSIYADADRDPDPSLERPVLDRGAPGATIEAAETPALPPGVSAEPSRTEEVADHSTAPVFESADVMAKAPGIEVWIDGHQAALSGNSRQARVGWDVSVQPVIRFKLAERMGEFRSIVIQVYVVKDNQAELASGVTFKEPGEASVLTPGRDIFLPRPGGRVSIRHIASGQTMPWYVLSDNTHYEIQFVVGGNKEADALSVRVHTAPKAGSLPPPATQPEAPEAPKLPPGVVIPDANRT